MAELRWFDGLVNYSSLGTPWLDRAIDAGLAGMVCNIAKGDDWDATLATLTQATRTIAADPRLTIVTDRRQLKGTVGDGLVAVVLGCDRSGMIGPDLWRANLLADLGVRHIHLCYMYGELYADGCGESRGAGLTELGREFIRAVNDLPMMLDLSHCSRAAAREALEIARLPVFSHSAAYAVHPGRRNRTDDEVRAMARRGGVIGVWNMPRSLGEAPVTVEDYARHIVHLVEVAGPRHVGIGLDATPALEAALRSGAPVPEGLRQHFSRCQDVFGTPGEFSAGRIDGFAEAAGIANVDRELRRLGLEPADMRRVLLDNWADAFALATGT